MGRLADRKVLATAIAMTATGATAFGVVGWLIYGSATTAILAAVTVLGEGIAVILAVSWWDVRRRRRGAHRRRGSPNQVTPAPGGWVPEGWDIPWDERLRHPTDPPE